jgi:NAD(P)-dependent dehydrogenase (short-subunit alcohol dehydrogenase family)
MMSFQNTGSRLEGRVALVTGALGGIGKATCKALAAGGAKVIASDAHTQGADDLLASLQALGACCGFFQRAHREAMMPKIESAFGLLDVLVNNAGIYRFGKVESASDELLESLMQVNIRGVVLGAQFAIAQMKRRSPDSPWASMIHLSSIAGLVGSPTSSLYSMTKGAVRLFSKSLALEMAQLGYRIRSNSVHPGIIDTDMAGEVAQALSAKGLDADQIREHMRAGHPMARMGQADEIARGIRFLASDDSAFMTGAELVIDGGWTAR